ncbi:MAG: T9SS type A sorting domain-containing protein [Bacteroidetes bacterium]|nr:T9SS type A sorting domain-containing protein [Bacteroidota bacterium]
MNHTPFDVVAGYNDGINRGHLNMRNTDRLINTEIGDSTLYLDNLNINRRALFHPIYRIFAGNKESYIHNYPNKDHHLTTSLNYSFSKQNKFVVDSGGDVIFKCMQEITLDSGFEVLLGGRFETIIDTQIYCNYHDSIWWNPSPPMVGTNEDSAKTKGVEYGGFKIYPNPSAAETVNVKYNLKDDNVPNLKAYSTTGNLVFNEEIQPSMNIDKVYTMPTNNLLPGLYFIILQTATERRTSKFVKLKN